MNKPQLDQYKTALDEHAKSLDGATLSRLHQARNKALEQPKSWWSGIDTGTWIGVSSAAVISLLAVFVWQYPISMTEHIENNPLIGLEIATLNDDLDLIEDIDFYYWLGAQEASTESSKHGIQTEGYSFGFKV